MCALAICTCTGLVCMGVQVFMKLVDPSLAIITMWVGVRTGSRGNISSPSQLIKTNYL